jgi:hypothetical protein
MAFLRDTSCPWWLIAFLLKVSGSGGQGVVSGQRLQPCHFRGRWIKAPIGATRASVLTVAPRGALFE